MTSTVTLLRAAARFFTGILIQVQVKSQPLFPIDQIFRYGEVHEWSLFLSCASFLCCVRLIISHFRRITEKSRESTDLVANITTCPFGLGSKA